STSNCVRTAYAGGGLGLKADVPVASSTGDLVYSAPPATGLPEISEDPYYASLSSSNLVSSLSGTLAGPTIQMYGPSGSGLGSLLTGVGTTFDTVVALLKQAVSTVLSPLLSPLTTLLLENLGLDLAKTEVGGRLSCGDSGGVRLVR
ncbi:MAG: hypothetical protein VW625_03500, partial [Perlucidibaca sp.]